MAERQARAALSLLKESGHRANIQIINDQSNRIQKGSSIVLWAKTNTGVIIGADAIGEIRKMAEDVGKKAAKVLITDLSLKSTTDEFLADMLIPYVALAKGKSAYYTKTITEHIESNIWLMEKMLNVNFSINQVNNLYRIEKRS